MWTRTLSAHSCLTDCSLAFWEPATSEDLRADGIRTWILVTEALFILVEIADVTMDLLIKYRW